MHGAGFSWVGPQTDFLPFSAQLCSDICASPVSLGWMDDLQLVLAVGEWDLQKIRELLGVSSSPPLCFSVTFLGAAVSRQILSSRAPATTGVPTIFPPLSPEVQGVVTVPLYCKSASSFALSFHIHTPL